MELNTKAQSVWGYECIARSARVRKSTTSRRSRGKRAALPSPGRLDRKNEVAKVVMVSWRPLWASVLFYHDAGRIIGAFVWPLLTLSPVGPSWLRVAGATSPISRALGGPTVSKKLPRYRLHSAAIELQSLASIGCMHPITRRAGKFENTSVACRLVLSRSMSRPAFLPSRFPP